MSVNHQTNTETTHAINMQNASILSVATGVYANRDIGETEINVKH